MDNETTWLKLKDAAYAMGTSVPTLHRWINSKENGYKLKAKRIGRKYYLASEVVQAVIDGGIVITFKR